MSGVEATFLEELRTRYGDGLRAVVTYDREGYEVHYLGEQADRNYSEADIDAIYDDIVLHEIAHDFQEALFDDMGEIEGKLRLFEDGTVAHFWPEDDDSGVFVGFDDSVDPGIRELVELATEYYA